VKVQALGHERLLPGPGDRLRAKASKLRGWAGNHDRTRIVLDNDAG